MALEEPSGGQNPVEEGLRKTARTKGNKQGWAGIGVGCMAAWAAVFGFGLAGCFAGVPSAARALRVCVRCVLRFCAGAYAGSSCSLRACPVGGWGCCSPFLLRYAAASVWCSCLAAVHPSLLVAFSLYFCADVRIFEFFCRLSLVLTSFTNCYR